MIDKRYGVQPKRKKLWFRVTVLFLVAGMVALAAVLVYLDARITRTFEGRKWAIPAKVYARPLSLFVGKPLTPAALKQELIQLGYEPVGKPWRPGQFQITRDQAELFLREFLFSDGHQSAQRVRLKWHLGRIHELLQAPLSQDAAWMPVFDQWVQIEPVRIGGIYPSHNEDRELIALAEVPPLLLKGLIVVEDKAFLTHHGISLRGIARAALANFKAGESVQGGSTLTQQLVKNLYLNAERTFSRKLVEALMAILLDARYDKQAILETYLNEIYLGQANRRAIHGFGLGAQFYFHRELAYLKIPELALLVGLIKGPSYYNPHRYPKRAKDRRDQILDIWVAEGLLSSVEGLKAKAAPLGAVKKGDYQWVEYPAFMDLVKRQLRREYREADLMSEGLRIFTHFDPRVQREAEERLAASVAALEKAHDLPTAILEAAAVITDVQSGEVLAMVGSRSPRYYGFNRALDAQRSVGSLAKPVVFLAALSKPKHYHLAMLLDDSPYQVAQGQKTFWQPKNYDGKSHGWVSLEQVLAQSYNQATVRLGMALGLSEVRRTFQALGLEREIPELPSMLLGAVSLSPFEVTALYQTLASGGYRMPLRAISAVTAASGEPLTGYGLKVSAAVNPEAISLLRHALETTVTSGTARYATRVLAPLRVAGKTGTTDQQRDSWFAGFSGDKLAVVWVGRDDNGQTPLTGSSGALRVWTDIMSRVATESLPESMPKGVVMTAYDPDTGALFTTKCPHYPLIPVHDQSLVQAKPCHAVLKKSESTFIETIQSWFR